MTHQDPSLYETIQQNGDFSHFYFCYRYVFTHHQIHTCILYIHASMQVNERGANKQAGSVTDIQQTNSRRQRHWYINIHSNSCLHPYFHTFIHTYIDTYIHSYLYILLYIYINTHPTYIHACMYTYIYTYAVFMHHTYLFIPITNMHSYINKTITTMHTDIFTNIHI